MTVAANRQRKFEPTVFSYLENLLAPDSLKQVKDGLVVALEDFGTAKFDAIAVSGYSGAVPGALVADALHKPLIVVRKVEDEPHHGKQVEGGGGNFNYVIVDDFMASGATVNRIVNWLYPAGDPGGTVRLGVPVGIFLWADGFSTDRNPWTATTSFGNNPHLHGLQVPRIGTSNYLKRRGGPWDDAE